MMRRPMLSQPTCTAQYVPRVCQEQVLLQAAHLICPQANYAQCANRCAASHRFHTHCSRSVPACGMRTALQRLSRSQDRRLRWFRSCTLRLRFPRHTRLCTCPASNPSASQWISPPPAFHWQAGRLDAFVCKACWSIVQ